MRMIQRFLLLALLVFGPSASRAAEVPPLRVHALLVIASKQPGPSDGRLASYEPTLRRILRFESFRLKGEGSTNVAAPGSSKIALSDGHTLELTADGKAGRLGVNWLSGGRSLMSTGLALRPAVPAVLGGPATGKEGEVWAVILVVD